VRIGASGGFTFSRQRKVFTADPVSVRIVIGPLLFYWPAVFIRGGSFSMRGEVVAEPMLIGTYKPYPTVSEV